MLPSPFLLSVGPACASYNTPRSRSVNSGTVKYCKNRKMLGLGRAQMRRQSPGAKGSGERGGEVGGAPRHRGGGRVPRRGAGDGLPLVQGGLAALHQDRGPLARQARRLGRVRKEERALGDAHGAPEGFP